MRVLDNLLNQDTLAREVLFVSLEAISARVLQELMRADGGSKTLLSVCPESLM